MVNLIYAGTLDGSDDIDFIDECIKKFSRISVITQITPEWLYDAGANMFAEGVEVSESIITRYENRHLMDTAYKVAKITPNPLLLFSDKRLLTKTNGVPYARINSDVFTPNEQFFANTPSELVQKVRQYESK